VGLLSENGSNTTLDRYMKILTALCVTTANAQTSCGTVARLQGANCYRSLYANWLLHRHLQRSAAHGLTAAEMVSFPMSLALMLNFDCTTFVLSPIGKRDGLERHIMVEEKQHEAVKGKKGDSGMDKLRVKHLSLQAQSGASGYGTLGPVFQVALSDDEIHADNDGTDLFPLLCKTDDGTSRTWTILFVRKGTPERVVFEWQIKHTIIPLIDAIRVSLGYVQGTPIDAKLFRAVLTCDGEVRIFHI
jgi:hypothetical protein